MADKEVEDHNAFNRWDSMGAAAMLGGFPAVICILFNDFDIKGAILWAVVAGAAAGGVFLLSLIINEKFLGKVVNLAGWVITLIYVVWTYDVIKNDIEQTASDPALEEHVADE